MPDFQTIKASRVVRRRIGDFEHDEKSYEVEADLFEGEGEREAVDVVNGLLDYAVASHTGRRPPSGEYQAERNLTPGPTTIAGVPVVVDNDPLGVNAPGPDPLSGGAPATSADPLAGGAPAAPAATPARRGRPPKNAPATPAASAPAPAPSTDPLAGGAPAATASTPAAQPTPPAATDSGVTDKQLMTAVVAFTNASADNLDTLMSIFGDYGVKRALDIPQEKRRGFLMAIGA